MIRRRLASERPGLGAGVTGSMCSEGGSGQRLEQSSSWLSPRSASWLALYWFLCASWALFLGSLTFMSQNSARSEHCENMALFSRVRSHTLSLASDTSHLGGNAHPVLSQSSPLVPASLGHY